MSAPEYIFNLKNTFLTKSSDSNLPTNNPLPKKNRNYPYSSQFQQYQLESKNPPNLMAPNIPQNIYVQAKNPTFNYNYGKVLFFFTLKYIFSKEEIMFSSDLLNITL